MTRLVLAGLVLVLGCGGPEAAAPPPSPPSPPPPPAQVEPAKVPLPPTTSVEVSDAEKEALIDQARALAVESILPPGRLGTAPDGQPLDAYIEAIVATNGFGRIGSYDVVACTKEPKHVCVAITGEACPDADEGCDGLSLSVVVDLTTDPPTLDSANGSFGPVASQDDVEQQLDLVP